MHGLLRDAVQALDADDAVVFGAPVSVGAFGDTRHLIGPTTHKEPRRIAEIRAGLHPREYRVFQGVIEKHQWPFWSRALYHAFGGRFGDHRNCAVIDAWADRIARSLASTSSTPVG